MAPFLRRHPLASADGIPLDTCHPAAFPQPVANMELMAIPARPRIGHNGGPPLNGPGWGKFVWRRAIKQAWRAPSPEVARLRLRRAKAIGLGFRRYQSISMHAGRPPTVVFFGFGGTLVQIDGDRVRTGNDGRVEPYPGIVEKLMALTVPSVFVTSNQAAVAAGLITEADAHGLIDQVRELTGGRIDDHRICTAAEDDDHPWRKPRPGMIVDLLQAHRLPPTAAIMVGGKVSDEACSAGAGLAGFVWANEYFDTGQR